jgi:ComF family protein
MASTASGAARLASNFRTSLDAVLAALFEPPCAACQSPLAHPLAGSICDACWAAVRTALPLDEHFDRGRPLARVMSLDSYDGRMKDIIHALKYDRRRSISPRLGALMRERGEPLLRDADCVVAVPLHPRREYMRGFNQAQDLAIHLGPPVVALLKRVRHTPSQIDLPRDQRLANVRDAFAFRPDCREREVVVLVDDVSTTGATLEACARVLKDAGVREVRALTAARVVNARR